jgi:PAS domain S-box-containing protein
MAGLIIAVAALLHKAIDQLAEQERNIRSLIETVPTGIVVVEQDGRIQLINSSAERLFGYTRQELLGGSVDSLLPERLAPAHARHRRVFNGKPQARAMGLGLDLSGRRKNGSEFAAEIGLSPFSRDKRKYTLATVIDVSERRRAQEREKLLARELQHRTQNLFSVIQAIASRSFGEGRTVAESKADFDGRLRALATANKALARDAWDGAPLLEIVTAGISGFPSSVEVAGCDIVVSSQAAQKFALVVHELATNAVKHGALSSPEGRVAITGTVEPCVDGDEFVFSWTERGGPAVVAPSRRGFGSVILEDMAKSAGDQIELEYLPEGLRYQLRTPLATITPPRDTSAAARAADVVSV